VRDIEDAGRSTYGVVLADLGAVLYGHVPPAKVYDAGAKFLVQLK
jgi:hypothetical protein